jgi:hypothetical protein
VCKFDEFIQLMAPKGKALIPPRQHKKPTTDKKKSRPLASSCISKKKFVSTVTGKKNATLLSLAPSDSAK